MTAEKLLDIKCSCKLHELRYFQEIIALSEDCDILFKFKCEYILNGTYRYPEGLKIYFYGEDEWLFDYFPTKSEASKILAEASLSCFDCVKVKMTRRAFL